MRMAGRIKLNNKCYMIKTFSRIAQLDKPGIGELELHIVCFSTSWDNTAPRYTIHTVYIHG